MMGPTRRPFATIAPEELVLEIPAPSRDQFSLRDNSSFFVHKRIDKTHLSTAKWISNLLSVCSVCQQSSLPELMGPKKVPQTSCKPLTWSSSPKKM